jgi:lipoate-protein ligase A
MDDLRFIAFGKIDPYHIMAAIEALFRTADKDGKNVAFSWIPERSLIMGYSQLIERELDLSRCKKSGYPVTRRITGGGTAFASDDSQVQYGLVGSLESGEIPLDMVESYRKVCGVVVHALEKFDLVGEFKPINDVLCNGKKISGSAQTRGSRTLLQHGTLLVDFNIKDMLTCCNIPLEKISDKGIASVEERMIDLNRILGRRVPLSDVEAAIRFGFEKTFKTKLVDSKLSAEERVLAEKLLPKYHDEDWIFRYTRRKVKYAGSYEKSPEMKLK